MAHGGFPVFIGRRGNVVVPLVRWDLVHPFPAHGQNTIRITGGDGLVGFPDSGTAGGTTGLDTDIAQRVRPQAVVDYGFTEQVIAEVIGEMPVVTRVDKFLEVVSRHTDEFRCLAECLDTQFLSSLVWYGPVEFRHTTGDQVNGLGHLRDAQLSITECNH